MNIANLCARISELAYLDDPRPGLLELGTGFDLVRKYDVAETQAILVTDHQIAVFAPRGTEPDKWRDWYTDSKYIKTDFPGGGRVHQGFRMALARIWDEVEADLEAIPYPKVYTGHSLGAALTLEAAVLRPPRETHVYGCPRVGNSTFAERLPEGTVRYENWFDPVTFAPPRTSPRQIIHAMRHGRRPTLYAHGGKRIRTGGFGHPIGRYVKATA